MNIVLNASPGFLCFSGATPIEPGHVDQRRRDLYATSTFMCDHTHHPGPSERVEYNTWAGKAGQGWAVFPQTVREHGVDPAAWVRCFGRLGFAPAVFDSLFACFR